MKKKKCFYLFSVLALIIIGIAVFAPWIATKDPYEAVMTDALHVPCKQYIWGTDRLGRDLFSRVIYGTRTSLFMAFSLVSVVFMVGTILGVIADMMVSFPGLVLAIAIAGVLGPNRKNAVIAIAAVTWTKYARLARSLVLKIRNKEYITAATDIGAMMMELAGLSFLGFGAQPPTPEWGLMLNEGRTYLSSAPWLMIYPGMAIIVVVIVFNLLGDSIRDILDPKQI